MHPDECPFPWRFPGLTLCNMPKWDPGIPESLLAWGGAQEA